MELSASRAAWCLLIGLAPLAALADGARGQLSVDDAWARATPPVASVGAVYMTIRNRGGAADRLLSLSTPAAGSAELHETLVQHGSMQMRALAFLDCAPGSSVKIAPDGMHIMLLGLSKPLVTGDSFPMTLRFRDAGTLTVQVQVR